MQAYNSSVTPLELGSLSQYTDEQRLNLLLKFNYENMVDDLTEEMISKESSSDQKSIQSLANPSYYKYLTKESLRSSYQEIFNRDIASFSNHMGDCPFFEYIPSLDIYVLSTNCGGMYGPYAIENFIYDYQETESIITVSVVYVLHDAQNNEYARYEDGFIKTVYESEDNFKLTEENIELFNRLEYQFKKNDNGKYYVYDIVNLDSSSTNTNENEGNDINENESNNISNSDSTSSSNNVKYIYTSHYEEGQIPVKLVDHTKETFDKSQCKKNVQEILPGEMSPPTYDIEQSKYFKKQSDGTYVATATLENYDAILSEYIMCDYWEYPLYNESKIIVHMTATIGENSLPFELVGGGYWIRLYLDDISGSPSFYTFNDSYLVVVLYTGSTTGPVFESLFIYDANGKKVFELEDIAIDRENIDTKLLYTKNCDRWWYEGEMATFGEIKYDTTLKKFIIDEEFKSVNEYCS